MVGGFSDGMKAEERANYYEKQKDYYQKLHDEVSHLLCCLITYLKNLRLETFDLEKILSEVDNGTLKDWWNRNKRYLVAEEGRKKEKDREERIRNEALSKLTDEEKEALGLNKPKLP